MDIYELVIAEEEYFGSKSDISDQGWWGKIALDTLVQDITRLNPRVRVFSDYVKDFKNQPFVRKPKIHLYEKEFHHFIKRMNLIQRKNSRKAEVIVSGKG